MTPTQTHVQDAELEKILIGLGYVGVLSPQCDRCVISHAQIDEDRRRGRKAYTIMDKRDRAFTRSTKAKAKRKAKRVMTEWRWFDDEAITPKQIGKAASVHCRFCSCVMCGNPRTHFNELTVQEKRQQFNIGEIP